MSYKKSRFYMSLAIREAYHAMGQSFPNPVVGAVIEKGGQFLAKAVTGEGGSPHAEMKCIDKCSELDLRGANLYVTLEPCCFVGKNPACVERIIEVGISCVYIAVIDPNPRVSGKSVEMLRDAGIKVEVGLLKDEAGESLQGFVKMHSQRVPYIRQKIAVTADYKIAGSKRRKLAITDAVANRWVHLHRAKADAILTGIGTVLADDPMLNCRIVGLESKSPIRIVLDSECKIPLQYVLVASANKIPLWLVVAEAFDDAAKIKELEAMGVKILRCKQKGRLLDIEFLLKVLAKREIANLFVEAGQKLNSSFLKYSDEIIFLKSKKIIGDDALDCFVEGLGIEALQANNFEFHFEKNLGKDLLRKYVRNNR
jgi:diaminohydroxyphosphoribosylaminopyrimidine deaminase / 5-amino-6-(5-phosphoribosylamino)uracil reductase